MLITFAEILFFERFVYSNETLNGGKAEYTKASSSVNITRTKGEKTASILPAICKAFGPTFVFGSVLKLIQDVLTFVSPQILRLIIQFVDTTNEKQEFWKGLLYAFLLFIVASVQTLILAQYFQRMFVVGLRIRTALISAVYRKALIMSNSSRKESTVGEIVNLMAGKCLSFENDGVVLRTLKQNSFRQLMHNVSWILPHTLICFGQRHYRSVWLCISCGQF